MGRPGNRLDRSRRDLAPHFGSRLDGRRHHRAAKRGRHLRRTRATGAAQGGQQGRQEQEQIQASATSSIMTDGDIGSRQPKVYQILSIPLSCFQHAGPWFVKARAFTIANRAGSLPVKKNNEFRVPCKSKQSPCRMHPGRA